MCRDNNFSYHCQKIFINSLRAPKKEQALLQYPTQQTPRVSPMTLSAFLLCIPQIVEQNRDRSQSTMKLLAPEQVFNLSYIYRELSNLFRNWYILGSHVPFIVHISRWRMDTLHYHRFVIIDSVDKCFKLKKWRLGIRNSGISALDKPVSFISEHTIFKKIWISARGNFDDVLKTLEKSHQSQHLKVFFFEVLEIKGWLFFHDDDRLALKSVNSTTRASRNADAKHSNSKLTN